MSTIPSAEEIAKAILEKLGNENHAFWPDPVMHSEQHEFLKMLMAERVEKLARRKAIQDKIAGSLILSSILGLVAMIGAGVIDYIKVHLK